MNYTHRIKRIEAWLDRMEEEKLNKNRKFIPVGAPSYERDENGNLIEIKKYELDGEYLTQKEYEDRYMKKARAEGYSVSFISFDDPARPHIVTPEEKAKLLAEIAAEKSETTSGQPAA